MNKQKNDPVHESPIVTCDTHSSIHFSFTYTLHLYNIYISQFVIFMYIHPPYAQLYRALYIYEYDGLQFFWISWSCIACLLFINLQFSMHLKILLQWLLIIQVCSKVKSQGLLQSQLAFNCGKII